MIGKGNPHNSGGKLAAYLVGDDRHHTAELTDMRGFGFVTDLKQAFEDEQLKVRGTRGQAGFFHVQWRAADGEGLSKLGRKDWADIANRCDAALGLAMQPRATSLHTDRITGDRHLHIGYSLVRETEDGKFYIQKLGLYKNKLKRLSRQLEKDYGLQIVSNERKPGNRARAGKRKEHEESNRLDTDINAIRNTILDCFEKSDSGKAFRAALAEHGLMLANGTKRDCFVVVDHAGGHHALNKALTGKTLAQTAQRFADIDRTQLPSVEQAQVLQRDRQGEQQQTRERAADKKPLGQTATQIRDAAASPDFARGLKERGLIFAYATPEEARASERAKSFAKAAGRQNRVVKEGFGVVDSRGNVYRIDERTTGWNWHRVQAQLATTDRSQLPGVAEARVQMKELNRAALEKKGTERKTVHSLEAQKAAIMSELAQLQRAFDAESRRTTEAVAPNFDRDAYHAGWEERLQKAAIEKAIEKEEAAKQAAWKAERAAEREAARPASWTESRIAECAEQARVGGASIVRDSEGNRMTGAALVADRLDGWRAEREARLTGEPNNYQPKGQAVTVHGREAFDGRLDEAGISIVCVTAADTLALDALRRDEYMQRLAAETNREAYKGNRFEPLEAGELAAVTGKGDVYRINPDKLGDAKHMMPENLPSVTEVRSTFKIDRENTDKLWEQWRAERAADRETTQERADSKVRQVVRGAEKAVDKTFAAPAAAIGKAARRGGRIGESFSKAVESILRVCSLFVGEPKDTPQQAHDKAQAAGNVGTRAAEKRCH
jgi:Relaxase/Mobilisation nuclease domain